MGNVRSLTLWDDRCESFVEGTYNTGGLNIDKDFFNLTDDGCTAHFAGEDQESNRAMSGSGQKCPTKAT